MGLHIGWQSLTSHAARHLFGLVDVLVFMPGAHVFCGGVPYLFFLNEISNLPHKKKTQMPNDNDKDSC